MRKARVVPVLLLLVLIVGCAATVGTPTQPLTPLQTAKMTAIAFLETYKAQYLDAEAMGKMALAGQLTQGQVEVYRVKRKLLIQVKPLIDTFELLVSKGAIPGASREQEINNVLNQLVAAGKKTSLKDDLRRASRESVDWINAAPTGGY